MEETKREPDTIQEPARQSPKPEPTPPPISSEVVVSRAKIAFEDTLYTTPKQKPIAAAIGVSLLEVSPAHYEISGEFARGGLGRILKAQDKRLGRPVAIKELLQQSNAKERFLQEAMITARLQHPGIVPIYEAGAWPSGEPFYSMKFVSGKPLNQVIAETESLTARLSLLPKVIAVTEAIAYAHSQKIIHRDLKPQNILIGEFGEAIVIDWGLAKDLSLPSINSTAPSTTPAKRPSGPFTVEGAVMGTPGYMPPEQARAEAVDERADVYSLGAILYHLLAGAAPRPRGESSLAALYQEPPPLEELQPDVPVELLTIVKRSMAPSVSERYKSTKELLEELERFMAGSLLRSHSYSPKELIWRWLRRYRAPVIVAALAMILVSVFVGLSVQQTMRANHEMNSRLEAEKAAHEKLEREQKNKERLTQQLYQELGAQQLSEGRALRSAFYLNRAYQYAASLGAPPDSLRAMLYRVMRSVEALLASVPLDERPLYAAFSPDGQRFLTQDWRGEITLFSAKDGHRLLDLEGEDKSAADSRRAIFLSDTRLLTQGRRLLKLWDVSSGELLKTFGGEFSNLVWSDVSSDRERLLLVYPSEIVVYQISSGELLKKLPKPPREEAFFDLAIFSKDGEQIIYSLGTPRTKTLSSWEIATNVTTATSEIVDPNDLRLSPDGKLLLVGCYGEFRLMDSSSLKTLQTLPDIDALDVSPDSALVAIIVNNASSVALWEVGSGINRLNLTGHSGQVTDVRFSPDGRTLAIAGADGIIDLWDTSSGILFAALEAHHSNVNSVRFSADGSRLLSTSDELTAKLWRVDLQPWEMSLKTSGMSLADVKFSPKGDFFAARSRWLAESPLDVWSSSGQKLASIPPTSGFITNFAISPDGEKIITLESSSDINVRDPKGALLFNLVGNKYGVDEVRFSHDGERIVTGGRDGTARIFSAKDGALLLTIQMDTHAVPVLAFTSDDLRLVTSELSGAVKIWDSATGELLSELKGQEYTPTSLELSNDDRLLLARSRDDKAHLWDIKSGALLATLTSNISSACFSPDQKQIFITEEDGDVLIWDVPSMKLSSSIPAHEAQILTLLFSHDGERFLTASKDKTVKLWSTKTHELLSQIEGHAGTTITVAFSPDDKTIVTAGEDGTIKLWTIRLETRSYEELQEILERRAHWYWEDGNLRPKPDE